LLLSFAAILWPLNFGPRCGGAALAARARINELESPMMLPMFLGLPMLLSLPMILFALPFLFHAEFTNFIPFRDECRGVTLPGHCPLSKNIPCQSTHSVLKEFSFILRREAGYGPNAPAGGREEIGVQLEHGAWTCRSLLGHSSFI
jgi:hypothetical protein